jgi:hypothetical protein
MSEFTDFAESWKRIHDEHGLIPTLDAIQQAVGGAEDSQLAELASALRYFGERLLGGLARDLFAVALLASPLAPVETERMKVLKARLAELDAMVSARKQEHSRIEMIIAEAKRLRSEEEALRCEEDLLLDRLRETSDAHQL